MSARSFSRHLPLLVFSLSLSLLLASCLPASAPPTLKLGLVAPFSGRDQALGYTMLFAAKVALREWNGRGGVGGYYIELLAQDDSNQAEMGALQARKMALDPQVVGVIGHPSMESASAAAPVYGEAGLPAVLMGIDLLGQESGPYVFHLGPEGWQLAEDAVGFAAAQGFKRLAIVTEATPSDQGLATAVDRAAKDAGLEVVFNAVLTPGQALAVGAAFEPPLPAALRGARPDLVYYSGGYVEGGELLAAMRAQGLYTAFLGGPGLASPDLLKIAGPASEGAYYQSPIPHLTVPEAYRFVEAYRALAASYPAAGSQVLQVYDGVNAMLEGLNRAAKEGQRPSRSALGQALAAGQYPGLSGPISFGEHGRQLEAKSSIYRIEGFAWPGRRVR